MSVNEEYESSGQSVLNCSVRLQDDLYVRRQQSGTAFKLKLTFLFPGVLNR